MKKSIKKISMAVMASALLVGQIQSHPSMLMASVVANLMAAGAGIGSYISNHQLNEKIATQGGQIAHVLTVQAAYMAESNQKLGTIAAATQGITNSAWAVRNLDPNHGTGRWATIKGYYGEIAIALSILQTTYTMYRLMSQVKAAALNPQCPEPRLTTKNGQAAATARVRES